MSILDNIADVRRRLSDASRASGRSEDDILLIGVSKTQSIDKLKEAYEGGIRVFGENKVQELLEKYDHIKDVSWHFIGHLQRNKVKYIVDKVDMIHSVDSLELAAEIDRRAGKVNKIMPVLIQINIGKESSKSGIFEEDVEEFIESLKDFKNILISGIMTIPPASDNKEETRIYFKKMKEIFDRNKGKIQNNLDFKYISMGMTGDFEIAVQEGANIVRVGTGIFGERIYKKEG